MAMAATTGARKKNATSIVATKRSVPLWKRDLVFVQSFIGVIRSI